MIKTRLKLFYILATIALVVCFILAGFYIGIVDNGFSPILNSLGVVFNASNWGNLTNSLDKLAAVSSILFVVIGGVLFVAWILASLLSKKRKWGLYGAFIHAVFCTFGVFFCASLIHLSQFEPLGAVLYFAVACTQFFMLVVFILSLMHLLGFEVKAKRRDIYVETNVEDKVIINNRYGNCENGIYARNSGEIIIIDKDGIAKKAIVLEKDSVNNHHEHYDNSKKVLDSLAGKSVDLFLRLASMTHDSWRDSENLNYIINTCSCIKNDCDDIRIEGKDSIYLDWNDNTALKIFELVPDAIQTKSNIVIELADRALADTNSTKRDDSLEDINLYVNNCHLESAHYNGMNDFEGEETID